MLDGFPTEPLTPESAKLCDEKLTIIYEDSWTCPQDPTCIKCKTKYIEKFRDIDNAFNEPEYKALRENTYLERFSNVEHNVLAVLGINYGQLYLFLNWACKLQSLGIQPSEFAVVVPTDIESYNVLTRMGFFCIDIEWTKRLKDRISSRYSGGAMSGDHSKINNVIIMVSNELVQLDFRVILHDVDIVWSQDIRPFLVDAGERRDILGMIAPYWKAKGTVNSGFIYVNPTQKSKILMQSLVNLTPLKRVSDQVLWNTVLRHHYFQQVSVRILPRTVFYKYSGHAAKPPGKEMMLFHSVGNSKKTHMQFYDLWEFNANCVYYDEAVDKASEKVNQKTLDDYKKVNKKPRALE